MEPEIQQPTNEEKTAAYLKIMKELQEKDEEFLSSLTPAERAKVNEQ